MKRILCIILAVILVLILTGCRDDVGDIAFATDRFIIVEKHDGNIGLHEWIVCDTETSILYLCVSGTYCLSMTPLLNKDGNPTHYEEYVPYKLQEIVNEK